MEVLAVRPVKQDEQTYKRWFDYADTGVYFLFPFALLSFFLFSTVIMLLVIIALASWSFCYVDSVCSLLLVVLVLDSFQLKKMSWYFSLG
jgi:hypothetical protein